MFEKSSAGNRSSSRDANYHQYRQALRYRSDRCSLGADRADVTGSPTRRPTTHNQHSRCVKRNLLSTTNRLPMAFAFPRVSSVEHGLSLLPSLEERWCLDLRPALNVPTSSTAGRSDRLSVGRHHGWPVGEDDGTWRLIGQTCIVELVGIDGNWHHATMICYPQTTFQTSSEQRQHHHGRSVSHQDRG